MSDATRSEDWEKDIVREDYPVSSLASDTDYPVSPDDKPSEDER